MAGCHFMWDVFMHVTIIMLYSTGYVLTVGSVANKYNSSLLCWDSDNSPENNYHKLDCRKHVDTRIAIDWARSMLGIRKETNICALDTRYCSMSGDEILKYLDEEDHGWWTTFKTQTEKSCEEKSHCAAARLHIGNKEVCNGRSLSYQYIRYNCVPTHDKGESSSERTSSEQTATVSTGNDVQSKEDNINNSHSNRTTVIIAVLSVAVGFLILVMVVIVCVFWRRARTPTPLQTPVKEERKTAQTQSLMPDITQTGCDVTMEEVKYTNVSHKDQDEAENQAVYSVPDKSNLPVIVTTKGAEDEYEEEEESFYPPVPSKDIIGCDYMDHVHIGEPVGEQKREEGEYENQKSKGVDLDDDGYAEVDVSNIVEYEDPEYEVV